MNDQSEKPTTEEEETSEDRRQGSSEERPRKRRTTSASSARSTSKASSAPKRANPTARNTSSGQVSAVQVVKKAVEQFSSLTSRTPESVVGARWENDKWIVRLEVVESRRIPDSADLLAEYEVDLDEQGELLAYSRNDRYVRGRPSE